MPVMRPAAAALLMMILATACGSEVDGPDDATLEATASTTASTTSPTATDTAPTAVASGSSAGLPNLGRVPPLEDLDGWLQTDISSLDELRGKVVVVQFWTFGCRNCKATLPNLQSLYAEHAGEEFEIVGIHSPEFEYEEDRDAIAAAADELGVTWPIALDTRQRNFFSWQGSPAYWPRTYVVDRNGTIRFDHIGEGAYDDLNETVAALLG